MIFRSSIPTGVAAAMLGLAGLLSACETTKRGFPEVSSPANDPDALHRRQLEAVSTQVAAVAEGKVRYVVPRDQLAAAFTRQFGDGTVIDKTIIRKVQETPKDKAVYYVVGMGLRNGMFRAMALPLQTSSDNSLYLTSNAARYIITGVGCTFCFFNFEKNEIVGTTCEENTGGSRCDLRVEDNNAFFPRR
ncbi:hypothetical protein [Hymenobacter weizhouensis]|uniref:hypothetical protein n=1 Tax=Hymenobacter sp. YIM 151500-1 TaxID=2987689 RepID=UPI0022275D37|nr:hypothetical protein [Hymenobacter sp. YIM 151500-1]UYZ63759.1 hypothetical protein OIS53_02695 [Hymenobacter sp. YIM 151500-1]